MTTIDRAGLQEIERCARRFDLLAKDRNHPGVDPVVAARALRRIAALRQPDQKGEAFAWCAAPFDCDGAKIQPCTTDANEAEHWRRLGHQVCPLYASPQPAPEAGKLPSVEDVRRTLLITRYGEAAADDASKWKDGRYRIAENDALAVHALLSPAQPHDVPCARCAGTSWVCENHPDKAWTAEGCECGAGMPCPDCDQRRQPPPHDVPAGEGDEDGPPPSIRHNPNLYARRCAKAMELGLHASAQWWAARARSTSGRA